MFRRSRILTVIAFFSAFSAEAATITAVQSGNWSAASTWTSGAVPTPGDNVIVTAGFTVTIDNASATCAAIQLGGSTSGAGRGTITFLQGSTLTVGGLVTVGASNNQGSMIMAAGGTLICEGFVANGVATWTPGTGIVELTASNTLPNNGITDFNQLKISAGTTLLNANLNVTGDLTIGVGAALDCALRTLNVGGNWINNGTFTGGGGTVIFDRNGNQSITGSGTNNFNLLRVNMGTSIGNTLEVAASHFSAPDGFLTISNGTFKMSGTFTFASTFVLGPIYNIQPTAGFWLNNPNVTVTAQAGGVSVRGILRITQGSFTIGTSADHNLDYVAGSSIIVEGGALTVAGYLGRNSPASTTSYSQSGGSVTVVAKGSTDVTNAGFDLGTAGSSFSMSGGNLTISRATSNATDYLNLAGSSSVTGGTLRLGDAGTPDGQVFRIESTAPVGSLLVSNASLQNTAPVAHLVSSSLNAVGGITVGPGSTFDANGLNLTIGGSLADSGTFVAGPSVTFSGGNAQSIISTHPESFNNVTINKSGGTLALNAPVTVAGSFSFTKGGLFINGSVLSLSGSVVPGSGTLSSTAGGTVVFNQLAGGQTVLAGHYGNITFNDAAKVLPPADTIHIAGSFSPGTASGHTVTGSICDFNGSAQIIPSFAYQTLLVTGPGDHTAASLLSIATAFVNGPGSTLIDTAGIALSGPANANLGILEAGTLTVGPGSVFTNSGSTSVKGSISGAGTLHQGAGGILSAGGSFDIATIDLSGPGNSVIYTGNGQSIREGSYSRLTIAQSGDSPALFAGNVSIADSARIASGFASTGIHTLILGGGATLSEAAGHALTGTVTTTRSVGITSGTASFGNIGADLILHGKATGTTVVTRKTGLASSGSGKTSISRFFDIEPAVNTGLNADLVFHYDPTDVNGQSEPALELYRSRDSGATWNNLGGLADQGARTVTVKGVNEFSRWTASDTSHRLGAPALAQITSLSPSSKTAGDSAFTLGVSGSEFVSGKSVVHFNGQARPTTYVSSGQLTAAISAADVQTAGAFSVTVVTSGAGTSNTLSLTVGAGAPSTLSFESASNGTGTPIQATSLASGSGITLYAVSRDAFHNFTGNVAATGWSLVGPSGGIAANDLVAAADGKSAQFTARLVGSAKITAQSGNIPGTPSGLITVAPGAAYRVRIETQWDGDGIVVPSESLAVGKSLTVFMVKRDSLNNYIGNDPADSWSLSGVTGGVTSGDLVSAADGRSAVLTGHAPGSASITVSSGALAVVGSGVITVFPATEIASGGLPTSTELMQNFPNPFNPSTTVQLRIKNSEYVVLKVYDMLGREVVVLMNEQKEPGSYTVKWDGSGRASGVYLLKMSAGTFSRTIRMVLTK